MMTREVAGLPVAVVFFICFSLARVKTERRQAERRSR
jgi:hypothetical protein